MSRRAIRIGSVLNYDPEEVLERVGEYDLVPRDNSDQIFVVERSSKIIVDRVEEGLNSAIVAAQRQNNFDSILETRLSHE